MPKIFCSRLLCGLEYFPSQIPFDLVNMWGGDDSLLLPPLSDEGCVRLEAPVKEKVVIKNLLLLIKLARALESTA